MSEYKARFHELSKYATAILPTEEEQIKWFVKGM